VWELMSDAAQPFVGMANTDVQRVVLAGETAEHLPCPVAVEGMFNYERVIVPCWAMNPIKRPTMKDVRRKFEEALPEAERAFASVELMNSLDSYVEPPSASSTPRVVGLDASADLYAKTPGMEQGGMSRSISHAILPSGGGEDSSSDHEPPTAISPWDQSLSPTSVKEDEYSTMPSEIPSLSTSPGLKDDSGSQSLQSGGHSLATTPGIRDSLYSSMPARAGEDGSSDDDVWMMNADHSSEVSSFD
jgi:Protein tyrosine and serine/threonine kinase